MASVCSMGCARRLKRLRATFPFALIDAHYAYPDGYAASLLAQEFRSPLYGDRQRERHHIHRQLPDRIAEVFLIQFNHSSESQNSVLKSH